MNGGACSAPTSTSIVHTSPPSGNRPGQDPVPWDSPPEGASAVHQRRGDFYHGDHVLHLPIRHPGTLRGFGGEVGEGRLFVAVPLPIRGVTREGPSRGPAWWVTCEERISKLSKHSRRLLAMGWWINLPPLPAPGCGSGRYLQTCGPCAVAPSGISRVGAPCGLGGAQCRCWTALTKLPPTGLGRCRGHV